MIKGLIWCSFYRAALFENNKFNKKKKKLEKVKNKPSNKKGASRHRVAALPLINMPTAQLEKGWATKNVEYRYWAPLAKNHPQSC